MTVSRNPSAVIARSDSDEEIQLLRVKSNFLNRIKLFLPVQSLSKKYSDFPKKRIALYPPLSCPSKEGRWPSSRTLGQDAVDASGAQDESAFLRTEKSFGPDASTPASRS